MMVAIGGGMMGMGVMGMGGDDNEGVVCGGGAMEEVGVVDGKTSFLQTLVRVCYGNE